MSPANLNWGHSRVSAEAAAKSAYNNLFINGRQLRVMWGRAAAAARASNADLAEAATSSTAVASAQRVAPVRFHCPFFCRKINLTRSLFSPLVSSVQRRLLCRHHLVLRLSCSRRHRPVRCRSPLPLPPPQADFNPCSTLPWIRNSWARARPNTNCCCCWYFPLF